jgi:hypothetical protein
VVRGQDDQVETVQYQKLAPILLNELQKLRHDLQQLHVDADTQTQRAQQQEETIRQQHERISQQREENRNLGRLAALEASLPSKAPNLAAAGAKEINTRQRTACYAFDSLAENTTLPVEERDENR